MISKINIATYIFLISIVFIKYYNFYDLSYNDLKNNWKWNMIVISLGSYYLFFVNNSFIIENLKLILNYINNNDNNLQILRLKILELEDQNHYYYNLQQEENLDKKIMKYDKINKNYEKELKNLHNKYLYEEYNFEIKNYKILDKLKDSKDIEEYFKDNYERIYKVRKILYNNSKKRKILRKKYTTKRLRYDN